MKILSNKEYNLMCSRIKALENDKESIEFEIKKQEQYNDHLIDEIYNDLYYLKSNLKNNMSHKKIGDEIQKIIRKLGGK